MTQTLFIAFAPALKPYYMLEKGLSVNSTCESNFKVNWAWCGKREVTTNYIQTNANICFKKVWIHNRNCSYCNHCIISKIHTGSSSQNKLNKGSIQTILCQTLQLSPALSTVKPGNSNSSSYNAAAVNICIITKGQVTEHFKYHHHFHPFCLPSPDSERIGYEYVLHVLEENHIHFKTNC